MMRSNIDDTRRHLERLLQQIPNYLYKYFDLRGKGLSRLISYIEESKLYFARPSQLNDPFECRIYPNFDATPDEIRSHWEENADKNENPEYYDRRIEELIRMSDSPEFQEKEAERLYEIFDETTGILSLTEHPDNLLMWSHYAGNHSGVVLMLRINVETLAGFPGGQVPYPVRVDYADEMPQFYYHKANHEEYTQLSVGTKSKDWRYENEWRLISPLGCGERRVPEGMMGGVIFGLATAPKEKQQILDVCSGNNYRIKVYETKRSLTRFALDILEV